MFRGLRLRLTLLYALAALALVTLVGGGAYLVVARYFRDVTDLALQHKMTHEFHALAAPIPAELAPADRDWSIVRGEVGLIPQPGAARNLSEDEAVARAAAARAGDRPTRVELRERDDRQVYEVRFASGARVLVDRASGAVLATEEHERDDDDEEHAENREPTTGSLVAPTPPGAAGTPLAYDAELAAIVVLPLDPSGQVLFTPSAAAVPLTPDLTALQAALATGKDLRTVTLADGRHVRMLTYRLTRSDGPAALQLGRVLGDQEQVLGQLTFGLLTLGSLSMVLVGIASWWLAGGALRPAQEAWERQQRFIASASHELRTPLTLIRASTEVALRGVEPGNADQRELLGDVLAESDHMRRLVDDLLTLSRLDSGKLPLTTASVELPPLFAELQRQVARLGAERGVTVAVEEVAGVVHADPERLRQVLLILLDNALRHTPVGGHITLTAASEGRLIRLRVSDTGCGIAPEHLPHIFERFYRADPARGRESGNAGLGLAIAKGLVEAMGGRIGATSTPGRGTVVWLTIPAA
jgi:signal transduction histidine kinase